MSRIVRLSALIAPLALAACVVPPPPGPSVMALPKQGDDFSAFQGRDASCRNFASGQIGQGSPAQAATDSAVGSAVLGTALGAATGAAIGSVGGAVGAGAAIGGAAGLLVGSAAGANNAQISAGEMQHRYDVAYTQCMVAGGYTVQQPAGYAPGPYYAPGYAYGPAYGYAAPYPYYYGYGPAVIVGGWGGGWHGGGWHGGGWGGGWHH